MEAVKLIKTPAEHRAALDEIERLMDVADSEANRSRLELLAFLVEDYEKKSFPLQAPDPIEAILFRMEQQNLTPRDLVPFLGSRSRVSEVLSGKRALTLPMIRALSEGLGIPAGVLIKNQPELPFEDLVNEEWDKYPVAEMIARGWINAISDLKQLFGSLNPTIQNALFRKSKHLRAARQMDAFALTAWTARVVSIGEKMDVSVRYKAGTLKDDVFRRLARVSTEAHGPRRAQEFLRDLGIALVVEPHLPGTFVDGAAILFIPDRPIIGLSVRYDRLDNFWFTLMHELAHVALHSSGQIYEFIDDLDVETNDSKEIEADQFAGNALIPTEIWNRSPARQLKSPAAAIHLANEAGVHVAIAAGKMRHFWKSYKILNQLVGMEKVRSDFPHVNWKD